MYVSTPTQFVLGGVDEENELLWAGSGTGVRTSRERCRQFNSRHKDGPLGEWYACTWRMRLIKIATCIRVTARHVRVFLCCSGPTESECKTATHRVKGRGRR